MTVLAKTLGGSIDSGVSTLLSALSVEVLAGQLDEKLLPPILPPVCRFVLIGTTLTWSPGNTKNDAEQELHKVVNEASIAYAEALACVIKNPAELTTILREIQKVRMLANAAVCYERVGITYRDLFSQNS